MKLSESQQNNLPDWAIYGTDNQGGVVVVDSDKAYTEVLKALKLKADQDSAEVARKWVTEILQRRLFNYGLRDAAGQMVAEGMTYEQMAAMRSELPGSAKVLQGMLRVRLVGKKYRLAGLPEAKTSHAASWRNLTPAMVAAGLI